MNACSLEVLQNFKATDSNSDEAKSTIRPLIIGCYQLNEDENMSGKRDGELRLYMVDTTSFNNDGKTVSFCNEINNTDNDPHCVCKTEAGILDGKWFQRCEMNIGQEKTPRRHLYAAASAHGNICLYSLNTSTSNSFLEPYISTSSDGNGNICLSLDLDETNIDKASGTGTAKLVSSYSDGTLAVHTVTFSEIESKDRKIIEEKRWKAHSLFNGMAPAEVWTCCWAKMSHSSESANNVVLSGGDDCNLKGWDLRLSLNPNKHIFQIGDEEHSAGVTAISWHPSNLHIFASGSYDEGVRIWDIRYMTSSSSDRMILPTKLAKIDTCGGGVWRLKWHPHDASKILVGAMHGGCKVLHVPVLNETNNEVDKVENVDLISSFTAHESMAYGADWVEVGSSKSQFRRDLVASCSFYDRQGFLWNA